MWFRGLGTVVALLLLAGHGHGCGDGNVKLELTATASKHRIFVNSVGQDLMFLMVNPTTYQAARVPDVSVSVVTRSERGAVLRADDGTTLTLTVVTDTAALYLVKVSWTNLKKEIWDCKELSKKKQSSREIMFNEAYS